MQARPVLRTIIEAADIAVPYPYRKFDEQDRDVLPILREVLAGKVDTRTALQQAQAVADRLFAS